MSWRDMLRGGSQNGVGALRPRNQDNAGRNDREAGQNVTPGAEPELAPANPQHSPSDLPAVPPPTSSASEARMERNIVWRGSGSDLATDVAAALREDPREIPRFIEELLLRKLPEARQPSSASEAFNGIDDPKTLIDNAKLFVEVARGPAEKVVAGMVRDLIRLAHQYEAERDEKQMALDGPIHTTASEGATASANDHVKWLRAEAEWYESGEGRKDRDVAPAIPRLRAAADELDRLTVWKTEAQRMGDAALVGWTLRVAEIEAERDRLAARVAELESQHGRD